MRDATIIPTPAIQFGQVGSYVYVVNPDSTVSTQVIKKGPANGEKTAVLSGLQLGETVVTDGVDRLYDGATVLLPGKQPPPDTLEPPQFPGKPGDNRRRWNNGQQQLPMGAPPGPPPGGP